MKQELTYTTDPASAIKSAKHQLFAGYGAMLLGYITEVVKDRLTAERYLVDIFSGLKPEDLNIILAEGNNTYCSLLQHVRKKLASFINTVNDCSLNPQDPLIAGNRFIDLMNKEEQFVFCSVHYYGKTIAGIAAELNKPEADVKQILKQSFTIIRNNRK
ncbi:hypothetical protein ACFQZX_06630 [Mucilaginibacter litoreus]|uniref:DNA-directed RNA polymerase specialized sigma subunit, sigma24 family n=1 Tax=Mucilaginibacter litoreus TaxID=1048221 RepID=A0ABW3AQY1_9SPHI